ncbi:hypothetical protein [Paenibacillus spongiae]|uniref:DUF3221 domain-containing protein n=1 Tax=Paenibacillus spongiae TaxID=2909671 RepID=A0ABY5SBM5_9BACL|nr:hypothetical protein [Paenibacillus spongiae]UVI29698.1 hypothetical protein L1F29_30550 [Paenibacillus spongiae]
MNSKLLFAVLICIGVVISGCNNYKSNDFTVSGKITSIDENNGYVYLDNRSRVIKYKDYNELKVGQSVKFVLYSTLEDDAWVIEKIKVKSVEILDTP